MLLLIRQLTGQNRSYLPPFPSLSVHPRVSHSPCRYRFRQATRGRAREAGRQPAHLGPSKVAPSLISHRPLLLGHPSQDPPISLENTHYTTVVVSVKVRMITPWRGPLLLEWVRFYDP